MAVSLPDDLVAEVLERLRVKSLMRFKCVKRSWNALFKTNTFVKRQRERQRQREGLDERFIILNLGNHLKPNHETARIRLLSSNGPTILQLHSQYPYIGPEYVAHPWGHCNGVIILNISMRLNENVIVMWNPTTREIRFLPPSPLQHLDYYPSPQGAVWFTSFGADPNTFNDFKLIKVYSMVTNNDYNNPNFYAFMYSTSTNSWTTLSDLQTSYLNEPDAALSSAFANRLRFGSSAYANGVGYHYSTTRAHILCFDFRSNQLQKLIAPPTHGGKLFEAGDSVAYVAQYFLPRDEGNFGFEIWILRQESGWTKICHFQPFNCFLNIYGIWKDCTEFIGVSEYNWLVSYNFNNQPMHQFQIDPFDNNFTMYKYVESMAPLSL